MKKITNEKAVSPLISVMLILFLVIMVAIIILAYSTSFMKKQRDQAEGHSFYYGAKILYAKVNPLGGIRILESTESSEIEIAVKRTDNEKAVITGVRFIFKSRGGSYSYNSGPPEKVGVAKIYRISNLDIGISDFSDLESVSIEFLYGKGSSTEVLDEIEIF